VLLKSKSAYGMLYIGTKPTLNGIANQVIEVNIFDFNDDIYDEEIKIEFLQYIRADMKFDSLEQLTDQISRDKEITLDILKQHSK